MGWWNKELWNRHRMLQIEADKDAQVATIIVGITARMIITEVAFIGANGGRIGDAIVYSINIHSTTISRPEQHGNHAGGCKTGNIPQDILRPVVLVVSRRVVHRVKILVPHWHLPHDDTLVLILAHATDIGQVARKIGECPVIAIPP